MLTVRLETNSTLVSLRGLFLKPSRLLWPDVTMDLGHPKSKASFPRIQNFKRDGQQFSIEILSLGTVSEKTIHINDRHLQPRLILKL